ncbi:MAG: glycosyltransferase [Acidobacteria bacterium]|nr:glycosyltransferase [Acidobacteriota bacterium]MBS1864903.1 glycosyltransferase [Acidobacteriota bacterium]
MRILNVTESYAPFYEFGGPPAKVEALSRGLVDRGNQVTVVTADWGVKKRIAGTPQERGLQRSSFGWAVTEHGVVTIYLQTWLQYRATSWNPAIGKFLKAQLNTFDVAHIFGLYDLLGPAVAKACKKQRVPYVVEPIGMFVPIVRNVFLKRLYHSVYGKEMLEGAARVIATSEQEMRELTEGGIPREKIELRRNGVMKPDFVPERGTFRRAGGITNDALVVLFLGRMSEKKSPELLLKSFAALPGELRQKAMLVYAGPDEQGMEGRLKNAAKELGISERVRFVGPIFGEKKWAAYRDADVFVLPSQNENFGNTAAEAAVTGTPVIVTENCGIAPLLKEAGIIIRHDEKELTQALKTLLGDRTLREQVSAKAIESTSQIGWKDPVEMMEILYRKLAENK